MNIQDLPTELQNKIFYYAAEHTCAKMINDIYKEKIISELECRTDMNGDRTLTEVDHHINIFEILEHVKIVLNQNHELEGYYNNLIDIINKKKRYRLELGDHYVDF